MKKIYLVYSLLLGGFCMDAQALLLLSRAFGSNEPIPTRYTCDGENSSPKLEIRSVPSTTKSLVLIVDDPDAPQKNPFVHWVLYNIPANIVFLGQGMSKIAQFPNGTCQGINDFNKIGYDGPCPPPGPAHRYFFRCYALDIVIPYEPNMTKDRLLKLCQGHIIDQAQLIGIYQRKK